MGMIATPIVCSNSEGLLFKLGRGNSGRNTLPAGVLLRHAGTAEPETDYNIMYFVARNAKRRTFLFVTQQLQQRTSAVHMRSTLLLDRCRNQTHGRHGHVRLARPQATRKRGNENPIAESVGQLAPPPQKGSRGREERNRVASRHAVDLYRKLLSRSNP